MEPQFVISIVLCIVVFVMVFITYFTLIPKDSAQNSKLLAIVAGFSYAASIVAYLLALYHFSGNPARLLQFLLLITMLVVLPASLISAAISTVTISNLRDTLAAAK